MTLEAFAKTGAFGMPAAQKNAALLAALNELTTHHVKHCSAYARMLKHAYPADCAEASTLQQVPYLPIALFKQLDLVSVPRAEIFKTLTSSGTSGQAVSRIHLDRDTARDQTRALAAIMSAVLGPKRLPMLIIDIPSLIKDRSSFSARGAGVLGMLSFGHDHCYALRDDYSFDAEAVELWLAKHRGERLLVFGFTFMVWEFFYKAVRERGYDMSQAVVVHSGGWKKLVDQAVSNEAFKLALQQACGIEHVLSFYGMAEQVGSVFVECERGHLHTPDFADVVVRDERDLQPVPVGQRGIIQVLSALPRSYPGHSILTGDVGVVVGDDGCGCGKSGRYFDVQGRVPRVELRGCSDTLQR